MVILVALAIAPVGSIAAADQLRWEPRAPLPTPRHEFAFARSKGRIFIMGGFIEGLNAVPFVDIYDPKTDQWTTGPSLPYAPNHAMAAAQDGVVYHLGGYQAALEALSDKTLALVDGAWVELPPMPEPRAAAAAEFLRGKLYVVGGVGPEGVVDGAFVYDPDKETWTTIPGPKTPREHHVLVRYRGRLYAVGGRALTFETTMRSIERYNPRTRRWSLFKPLPYATAGHVAAVTSNGYLVVLGGEGVPGPFGDAVAMDLETKEWSRLPSLDPARTGFGIAAFGSMVYSFGGAGSDAAYYDLTESIDLSEL